MITLLYLYALEVGGVGWITLNPTHNPVTAAIYVMAVGPTTFASAVTPLPAMVVAAASMYMMFPPFRVKTPTSSTAITLPSVGVGLMARPALIYKVDVIRSHLSIKGCMKKRAVSKILSFRME